jgi:hypothetical protein
MDNANANPNTETPATPEDLAKRWFVLTLVGVIGYIAVVFALLSFAD